MNKKSLIKILVSVVLLTIIFLTLDMDVFLASLSSINKAYLPVILGLLVLNYIVSSVRWKRLLSIYPGSEKVSTLSLVKLYFEGSFFNNFMPTSIGGDVYKAVALGKLLGSGSNAFASTFMERFSGVVVLGILACFGLVLTFGKTGLLVIFVACILGLLGIFFLSLISKKISKVRKFTDALLAYKNSKSVVLFAVFTSIFVQIFTILTQFFIFKALGYDIPLGFAFLAFPVIILASFFIPSQNSIGVQDVLYTAFFATIGIPPEGAVSASIVHHLARLAVSLVGGITYAINK